MSCCDHDHTHPLPTVQAILWLVIAINAAMFAVEVCFGVVADSAGLWADALDFAGDSLTYFVSLMVLTKHAKIRAIAAMVKAISMLVMGLAVAGFLVWNMATEANPDGALMTKIGVIALVANVVSALVLYRFRAADSNLRSVWVCSRNDAINNLLIIGAGTLVIYNDAAWPDLAVATFIVLISLQSAFSLLRQAWGEYNKCRCETCD